MIDSPDQWKGVVLATCLIAVVVLPPYLGERHVRGCKTLAGLAGRIVRYTLVGYLLQITFFVATAFCVDFLDGGLSLWDTVGMAVLWFTPPVFLYWFGAVAGFFTKALDRERAGCDRF